MSVVGGRKGFNVDMFGVSSYPFLETVNDTNVTLHPVSTVEYRVIVSTVLLLHSGTWRLKDFALSETRNSSTYSLLGFYSSRVNFYCSIKSFRYF